MTDVELTHRTIGAAMKVHRLLGPGLPESGYEGCLCKEFTLRGLAYEGQKPVPVVYQGVKLECGYRIDLLVENRIVVEFEGHRPNRPNPRSHCPHLPETVGPSRGSVD